MERAIKGFNGLFVDARYAPREIQEEAYLRDQIPYIPGEREGAE